MVETNGVEDERGLQHAPIDFEREVEIVLTDANDSESHVERDPHTFHPSQIARCERRAYCSKLGLEDQSDILGIFQTGTLIHEFLEERLCEQVPDAEFEKDVGATFTPEADDVSGEPITFTGRTDCYDPRMDAVYDFKTRNGWYNFDPPTQRHIDQMLVYMAALGADRGQVVYLSKSDMEVRTWPEDEFFEFDADRFGELVAKAGRIRDAIAAEGIAESAAEIPFEKCDCYFCEQESLVFEEQGDETDA